MNQPDNPTLTPSQLASIDRYFRANVALYQAFSQACRQQFSRDIAAMNAAVELANHGDIRRQAHSLKTVFEMLGYPAQHAQALELEQAANAVDTLVIERLWPMLREYIHQLENSGA